MLLIRQAGNIQWRMRGFPIPYVTLSILIDASYMKGSLESFLSVLLQVLLPADRIDSESQAEGKVGKMWGHFSDGMSLKASSIKVRVHF